MVQVLCFRSGGTVTEERRARRFQRARALRCSRASGLPASGLGKIQRTSLTVLITVPLKSGYTKRGSWTTKKVNRRRSAASARGKASRVTTVSMKRKALINIQALPPVERGKEIHFRGVVLGRSESGQRTNGLGLSGDSGSSTYKHLITQIPQGSGVEERNGRVIKLRRLTLNYTINSGIAGYGANARVVVIFDKRPERTQTLEWVDVFTSTAIQGSMINSMLRENRDGSFEVLYDKTTFVEGARPDRLGPMYYPNAGGALQWPDHPNEITPGIDTANLSLFMNARNSVAHKEVIDLSAKRFYTQYSYTGTSGVESDHEYGTIHMFAWSDINVDEFSQWVPRFNAQYELEFMDY